MDIQFATKTYKHESPEVSSERCVNAYAERQPKSAKTEVAVLGSPGIAEWASIGSGPIRGAHIFNEVPHFVSGDALYSIDSAGSGTFLGAGITGGGPVSIDNNGTNVVITNGAAGWEYHDPDGLSLISDPQFFPANTVTFLDSRLIHDRVGTNEFFHSDVLDATYPALNSGAAESSPDIVSAVKAHLQTLFVFGGRTIEPWKTTANTTFPFQIVDGATVQRGTYAPYAVVSEDNALFFIGDDFVFYRINGLQLIPLSDTAVVAAWQKYPTITDAYAFTYTFKGQKFICLHFPSGQATWEVNLSTGLWHERESLLHSGQANRWRGNNAVTAYGKVLIGDRESGKVGYLDSAVYQEFGSNFTTTLIAPTIHGNGALVFMPKFELDMATGVGLQSGQGSMPMVFLDYSDDGGHTFISFGQAQSIGLANERFTRVCWHGLGSFYQRILRVRISDPVRRTIMRARCPGLAGGMQ